MEPILPTLAILPVHSLILHEDHDDSRTQPLIDKIKASGVFSNPPIVTPLHDHTARYMVLDGANRTTAMRKMGCEHILAQVVEPNGLGIEVETWNHVAWEMQPSAFYEGVRTVPGVSLRESDAASGYNEMIERRALAVLHRPDGKVFTIHVPIVSAIERNEYLHRIVNVYKGRTPFDRTNIRGIEPLLKLYPALSGLIIMPRLRISHVLQLAGGGHMLPAGITRFTISPRALRVNYPLDELTGGKSLEEKNDALDELIMARVARKGVRYYAEATVLYDE